jgi:uncharacterized membrane protein
MVKTKKNTKKENNKVHPIIYHVKSDRSLGQMAADFLTKGMGSWSFMIIFVIFLIAWVITNVHFMIQYNLGKPWDPYPFILLNLVLSMLAAIQAPIILMSQNRQSQIDRIRAEYDYSVNRKAQRQIEELKNQIYRLSSKIKK